MQRIIGYLCGKSVGVRLVNFTFNYSLHHTIYIMLLRFRVKQEEARACKPAQSLCNYPSLIISTEWCTYIQGILIAALLVIAIARFLLE